MCLCVLVCMNFGKKNSIKGEECNTWEKLEIFKNGKMIIIIIIKYNNGSGKPRKFSRYRMMKQTVPLNSCREI